MKNHAIADAFESAGYNTARDQFHVACVDALRRADMNAPRAADMLRDDLNKYLVAVARDMNGKPQGGGQDSDVAQAESAPAERPTDSGGRGQVQFEAHRANAPSPATPRDGDKGQVASDAHTALAPPSRPHRDGADHKEGGAQVVPVRPVREPNVPKRGLAAMGAASKKLYADFHVGAAGMALGEIRVASYERMIFAAGREKVLGRCLKAYAARQAHVPKDAKTRDIVEEELLGRMIAFSKHASLHGIEYMNDAVLLEQMEAHDVQ